MSVIRFKKHSYERRFGRWYEPLRMVRCTELVTGHDCCVGIQGHTHDHFCYRPEGILVTRTDGKTQWHRAYTMPKSPCYIPPGKLPTYLDIGIVLVRDKNAIKQLERIHNRAK